MKNFLRIASATFLGLMAVGLMGSYIQQSSYNLVQNSGTPLTRRTTLNCINGVTCADSGSLTTISTAAIAGNYSQSFVAQTTVILAHNLGTLNVIVTCYDTSTPPLQIIPNTTAITDTNDVTVTFSIIQSGYCVVNGLNSGGGGTAKIYHYQYIPGGSLISGTTNNTGSFSAGSASNLTANTPIVGPGTGPGMSTLASGGSSAIFQIRVPTSWDSSAITLDVDGVYDVATTAGTIILVSYSSDLHVGNNAQVVTWSSASSSATVNATNNTFPSFPVVRWSLTVPSSLIAAGDFIYISVARPSGDTFGANAYILGANLGIKY